MNHGVYSKIQCARRTMSAFPSNADIGRCKRNACQGPIVLKKSKMPPQRDLRESELIADFRRRCPLKAGEKATEGIRSCRSGPPRPKAESAPAVLKKLVPTPQRNFQHNRPKSDLARCPTRVRYARKRTWRSMPEGDRARTTASGAKWGNRTRSRCSDPVDAKSD